MHNRNNHKRVIEQLAYEARYVAPDAVDKLIELQEETKPSRVERSKFQEKRKDKRNED